MIVSIAGTIYFDVARYADYLPPMVVIAFFQVERAPCGRNVAAFMMILSTGAGGRYDKVPQHRRSRAGRAVGLILVAVDQSGLPFAVRIH